MQGYTTWELELGEAVTKVNLGMVHQPLWSAFRSTLPSLTSGNASGSINHAHSLQPELHVVQFDGVIMLWSKPSSAFSELQKLASFLDCAGIWLRDWSSS